MGRVEVGREDYLKTRGEQAKMKASLLFTVQIPSLLFYSRNDQNFCFIFLSSHL